MKERPILFNAPMVRALLNGTKTQTRRVAPIADLNIKPHGEGTVTWGVRFSKPVKGVLATHSGGRLTEDQARRIIAAEFCPYGQPGDRLWVRETWQGPLLNDDQFGAYQSNRSAFESPEYCRYAADGGGPPEFFDADDKLQCRWRPSIHMNRWASRILLEIVSVRVERLQEISDADARAEGIYTSTTSGIAGMDAVTRLDGSEVIAIPGVPRMDYRTLWEQINGPGSWDANPFVWCVEFKRVTR